MTDTIKLLRECNAGIKMGEAALRQVIPHVRDKQLKSTLIESKKEHTKLADEVKMQLHKQGADTKNAHRIAQAMSTVKIYGSLIIQDSDSKIADLMTDGCDMGIKFLNKYMNQYKGADDESRDLTKRIIESEECLEVDLRGYL